MNRNKFATGDKREKKKPKPGMMVWVDTVLTDPHGQPNGHILSSEPAYVRIEKSEQRDDGMWWMVNSERVGNFWRKESDLHL